jgi:hypothetical protein
MIKERLETLDTTGSGSSAPRLESGPDVELLPCPFCGSGAHFGTIRFGKNAVPREDRNKVNHFVSCDACNSTTQTITGFRTQAEAAERWNRRSPELSSLRTEVERLRKVVEHYADPKSWCCDCEDHAPRDPGVECFFGMDLDYYICPGNGYDIAQEALKTNTTLEQNAEEPKSGDEEPTDRI